MSIRRLPSPHKLRIGTRGSALARWQTDHVASLLRAAWVDLTIEIVVITTGGDKALDVPLPLLGGKGAFTEELEVALRNSQLDLAVHSLKDLPTTPPDGLILGAIPPRGAVRDALISRGGHTLDTLPSGSTVGTGSVRRAAQLLARRPDLRIESIRGNVDTRIRKALDPEGMYDAIVVAEAGLERIGRLDVVTEFIPLDVMLPAPGQGALAVQCRDETAARDLLAPINHADTEAATIAERAFLAGVGTGCSLPVAAHAEIHGGHLTLHGRILSANGRQTIEAATTIPASDLASARSTGFALALDALANGGESLMDNS